MDLLEALNRVLRSAGQEPITDLSDQSMERGNAVEAVNRARKQILSNGYAFNTDVVDLQPDSGESNKVNYPTGFLFVGLGPPRHWDLNLHTDESRRLSYRYTNNAQAALAPFIWDLKERSFVTEEVVNVVQVFDVFDVSVDERGFDRIPQLCAEWVATRAAADYFHEYNGAPSTLLELRAERAKSRFVNRETFADIHTVTGFRSIEAIGRGGSTSSFDVRTQT